MTQITKHQDIWKPATEADKAATLASLSGLPSRAVGDDVIDRASYYAALRGVTRYSLVEGVQSIFGNALGHPFFPWPQELRRVCDDAMKRHHEQRAREVRQERIQQERLPKVKEPTEAERERVKAILADFYKGYEKEKAEETFKLDPELVALVPDNPKAQTTFKRLA